MKILEWNHWLIEASGTCQDGHWNNPPYHAWISDPQCRVRGFAKGPTQADALLNALIALRAANQGMADIADSLERELRNAGAFDRDEKPRRPPESERMSGEQ